MRTVVLMTLTGLSSDISSMSSILAFLISVKLVFVSLGSMWSYSSGLVNLEVFPSDNRAYARQASDIKHLILGCHAGEAT